MASDNSASSFSKINPFDGRNYEIWRQRMQIIMSLHEVDDIIVRDVPEDPSRNYMKKNAKAMTLISQNLSDSHFSYCADETFARSVIHKLDNTFLKTTVVSKLHLRTKLSSIRPKPGEKLVVHFQNFGNILMELRRFGGKIDKLDAVNYLLMSLPSEFDTQKQIISSSKEENITL